MTGVKQLVIIPTYNEIGNIARMIDAVMQLPVEFDLLVVDDGSPDGTAEVVRQLNSPRVHLMERSGKLGLGSAYIAGFKWALEKNYDYIYEMDCDFSHNPNDLVRLSETLTSKEADVVVGSRYVAGVNVVNWPMGRLLLSYFASMYVRIVTRMKVKDATAGFVGYSKEALSAIDLDRVKMQGYGFQIEMKYTAIKLGFKLRELSIIFTDRCEGVSKMSGGIFSEALFGVLALPLRRIRRRSI
ncbi:MAG: polyprenol monophosphomannose synthase [Rikenellaceae bacterium]